ncbi:hypothetical protein PCS_03266 [Desulfocurvibacter africanus PCS]|uniref:Uncharacterized protein n=1 Tax=Desulfocurvibacter africanus PCS TaxID=1262666 RepID=M5PZQ6_DESAF|nr:hypothetical protein [Desulfocurvibacter africanus]EMG36066.1 hypothetical protein PCS_03266 [Desulfocurvibacter africanus PCS]
MSTQHVMIFIKLGDISATSVPRLDEALKSYGWEKSKFDSNLWRATVGSDEEQAKLSTQVQKQLITAANFAEAGAFMAVLQVGNSQPVGYVFKKGDALKWNRSAAAF